MREKHGSALLSILVTIEQTALFTLAFYLMFAVLPMRAASIRGDFFIYRDLSIRPIFQLDIIAFPTDFH